MDKLLTIKNTHQKIKVEKILCLGKNYIKHIEEMSSAKPDRPVVFLKPNTALVLNGGKIEIPPFSKEVHHEVELVVVIGKEGKNIKREDVHEHILGYALGLDITLRDIQAEAKKKGHPWCVAKGFDTSAPVSEVIPRDDVTDPHNLDLKLWVNGELRQDGNTKAMMLKVEDIISYLSTVYTLEPGDLVYTGTPEGVAQLLPGDTVKAEMGDLASLELSVI